MRRSLQLAGSACVLGLLYATCYLLNSFFGGYYLRYVAENNSDRIGPIMLHTSILWQPRFGYETDFQCDFLGHFFHPLVRVDRAVWHKTLDLRTPGDEKRMMALKRRDIHPDSLLDFDESKRVRPKIAIHPNPTGEVSLNDKVFRIGEENIGELKKYCGTLSAIREEKGSRVYEFSKFSISVEVARNGRTMSMTLWRCLPALETGTQLTLSELTKDRIYWGASPFTVKRQLGPPFLEFEPLTIVYREQECFFQYVFKEAGPDHGLWAIKVTKPSD